MKVQKCVCESVTIATNAKCLYNTFDHWFQPHLAEKLAPLHDLMKGRNKKAKLVWSDQAEESFQNVRKALTEVVSLQYLDSNAELSLMVDVIYLLGFLQTLTSINKHKELLVRKTTLPKSPCGI